MPDLFKALLKAGRLARKGRTLSAALAVQRSLMAPAKPKRKSSIKAKTSRRKPPAAVRPQRPLPGSFTTDEFNGAAGKLSYRLYTPVGSTRRRLPLVVMLHGCSQFASDFAVGTNMNRLADELGFLVLYPQQSQATNLARCWNWHDPRHQARGSGEPAMIAALTRHAMSLGRANPARVYIAGLSAGGAAAAIVAAAYPDLYVAVGVHSALAQGDIRSIGGALSAMRGKGGAGPRGKLPRQLPTIVFHGDDDRVVHSSNAAGFLSNLERSRTGPLVSQSYSGRSKGGRNFNRKIYRSGTGEVLLEDWMIQGIGHGWSGGSHLGSYTEPAGPDASREMLRFFLSRKRMPKKLAVARSPSSAQEKRTR
jgi:poly(hydroxyalkanoate) depolymerase family esterase